MAPLDSCLSWCRTKVNIFFGKVLLPRIEALLVWYLKFSGQRSVEKYWRGQLKTGLAASVQKLDRGNRAAQTTFEIRLGTVREHGTRFKEISDLVNGAYVRELRDALVDGADGADESAFSRTSPVDIQRRLLTDDEVRQLRSSTSPPLINRVLFLAVAKTGEIIGTCAATLAAPWCPSGCGSWGLLAVSTPQLGVGRALVEHCEDYIRTAMLGRIRIEFFFIAGIDSSESLRKWYEERMNYDCFKAESSGRSYRGNLVRGEVAFRHCEKVVDTLSDVSLSDDVISSVGNAEKAIFDARRRRLAKFLVPVTPEKSD